MRAMLRLSCWVFASVIFSAVSVSAQVTTGTPPFGSYTGGPDVINLANLNAHFTTPVFHKPGRGGFDFDYDLTYDTSLWYPVSVNGTTTWTPVTNYGWNGILVPTAGGQITNSYVLSTPEPCNPPSNMTIIQWPIYTWVYIDSNGVSHHFPGSTSGFSTLYPNCNPPGGQQGSETFTAVAQDSSGYLMTAYYPGTGTTTVYSSVGSIFGLPINYSGGNSTVTDRNGNEITFNGSSAVFTDSVGKTALSFSGIAPSPTVMTYTTSTGGSGKVTVYYVNYQLKTNFGCSGVVEYNNSSVNLVDHITLADSTTYSFTYEQTPGGTSGQVTGRLKSITFPTGGTITYNYTGGSNGITCSDGSAAGLTRTMPDSSVWTFARASGTTTVTAPQLPYDSAANQTVYTFTGLNETSRKIYQGSSSGGTLLRTINTAWSGTPTSQITILEDGSTQSKVTMSYDQYGNLLTMGEYDWGTGAPGSLLRTTTNTYMSPGSTNLASFLASQIVQDGNGNIKSRVNISYDGFALTCRSTPIPQHDDSGHGCTFTPRANQTSVTTYTTPTNPPSGATTRNAYYDQLGNSVSADLSCCQQKQWNYSTTTNYAYPDSVVSGSSAPQLTTSATYDLNMGLVLTSTDENSQVITFTYDNMGRVTNTHRPDGQNVTGSYTDVANGWVAQTCSPVSGSTSVCRQTSFDNMGRAQVQEVLSGTGTVYSTSQTTYDVLGRTYKVSNPYTGSPQYWTETDYDALSRPVKTILPDRVTTTPAYSLNTVTATDPAGKQLKSQVDGLRRLTTVYEPDVTNGNALTQTTSYTYDVFDNLTQVKQGVQTRSYVYDALARLTSATTPEAGQVQFQYNADNLLTQRTDARGVITTYTFDSLNRPTGLTYNVGSTGVPATPSIELAYGTNPSLNNNGRLLSMTDGVGSETYSYDILGNLTGVQKIINGTTFATNYAYDYAGDLTALVYPSGRVVQQSYDAIGRLCAVGTVGSSCSSGTTYSNGFTYSVAGQLTALTYGNGVAASLAYSPDRLQLQSLTYLKGSSTLFSTNYWYKTNSTYCPSAPAGNNGQIQCITDNVDNGRSATYGYDALYRLTSAVTAGSSGYSKWGLSWTYDRYGNRTAQTVTAGTGPSNNSLSFGNPGGAQTNRPDGYSFDANGNMKNDGTNTITYDAENRIVSSTGSLGSGSYAYDGNSLRVQKVSSSTTTVYIFSGSEVIAEYTNGGVAPSVEYVYSGSQMTATIASASYNGSAGSGSADVGGGEQSKVVATPGTGGVTISGSEQSTQYTCGPDNEQCTMYDSGTVSVTVNGFGAQVSYGEYDTTNTIASALITALNATGSPVTASGGANSITLVAKTPGSGSNYPLSTSVQYNSAYFSHASFTATPSGSTLTGGTGSLTPIYDTGTAWATVNGFQASTTYGQNDTASTVAANIANVFNTNNSSPVTAVVASGSLTLTSKTGGSGSNYPLSSGSSTSQPSTFSHPSFSVSVSGTTLGWTAPTYYQGDHLSLRLITDLSGNVLGQKGHYPYGETWYEANTTTKWKFTSYERDSESGNDYAMARYYVNRFGRFPSPDLMSGNLANPQTLNRYAYALNDPIDMVDPSGLCSFFDELGAEYSYNDCIGGGGGGWSNLLGGGGGLSGSDAMNEAYAAYSSWADAMMLANNDGEIDLGGGHMVYLNWNVTNGVYGIKEWNGNTVANIASLLAEIGVQPGEGPGPGTASEPAYSSGSSNSGGSVNPFVNLAKCAKDLYNVTIVNFAPAAPGSNGTFAGMFNGNRFFIETDVASYSSFALTVKAKGPLGLFSGKTAGLTLKSNPNLNYIANDLSPEEMYPTIWGHELGHSLDLITTGNTSEASAEKFEDCIIGLKH